MSLETRNSGAGSAVIEDEGLDFEGETFDFFPSVKSHHAADDMMGHSVPSHHRASENDLFFQSLSEVPSHDAPHILATWEKHAHARRDYLNAVFETPYSLSLIIEMLTDLESGKIKPARLLLPIAADEPAAHNGYPITDTTNTQSRSERKEAALAEAYSQATLRALSGLPKLREIHSRLGELFEQNNAQRAADAPLSFTDSRERKELLSAARDEIWELRIRIQPLLTLGARVRADAEQALSASPETHDAAPRILETMTRDGLRRVLERIDTLKDQFDAYGTCLMEANQALVVRFATSFQRMFPKRIELMELIQLAQPGLKRAVDGYDATSGYRFSTYADPWIKRALIDGAEAQAYFPLTDREKVVLSDYIRVKRKFLAQGVETPSLTVAAEKMGVKKEQLLNVLAKLLGPVSLHQTKSGEDPLITTIVDEQAVPVAHRVGRELLEEHLRSAIAALTPREAAIIKMRFGLESGEPMTLQAVGSELKITRERVRQIEADALRKLRLPFRSGVLAAKLELLD